MELEELVKELGLEEEVRRRAPGCDAGKVARALAGAFLKALKEGRVPELEGVEGKEVSELDEWERKAVKAYALGMPRLLLGATPLSPAPDPEAVKAELEARFGEGGEVLRYLRESPQIYMFSLVMADFSRALHGRGLAFLATEEAVKAYEVEEVREEEGRLILTVKPLEKSGFKIEMKP